MYRKDKQDLTNMEFGYLRVLSENIEINDKKHTYWNCLCKCGNICVKRTDVLRSTPIPSCGCHKLEATSNFHSAKLTGKVFGKLKVIDRVPSNEKRALWKCECECGNICYLRSRHLLFYNVKSCGCDTKSTGELFIREQLQNSKYSFKEEFTFPDCLTHKKRRIRFDFAVFENDNLVCLIEVNGLQHYSPIDFFGGIKTFKDICIRDKIKREYCKAHNILLIEIPYTEIGVVNIFDRLRGKKGMYKIWVDDCRVAPKGYIWFKTVNRVKEFICNHSDEIELLDLDHDASEEYSKEGGDYIRLLDWLEATGRNYPIRIHSMNVVGRENMRRIIQKNGWTEIR